MFHLPVELIRIIYEYDSTCREKYNTILKELTKTKILTFLNKVFYVYDVKNGVLHMTDSLVYPCYICTSYNIGYFEFLKIKKKYNLIQVERELKFDIETYTFDNLLYN